MAKKKDSKTVVVGYRYKCRRTCFFNGKRVFQNQSITVTEELKPAIASHFDEPFVLTKEIVQKKDSADPPAAGEEEKGEDGEK